MDSTDTIQVRSTVTITLDHSSDCWSRSGRACTCGLEERLRWEMRGQRERLREAVAP